MATIDSELSVAISKLQTLQSSIQLLLLTEKVPRALWQRYLPDLSDSVYLNMQLEKTNYQKLFDQVFYYENSDVTRDIRYTSLLRELDEMRFELQRLRIRYFNSLISDRKSLADARKIVQDEDKRLKELLDHCGKAASEPRSASSEKAQRMETKDAFTITEDVNDDGQLIAVNTQLAADQQLLAGFAKKEKEMSILIENQEQRLREYEKQLQSSTEKEIELHTILVTSTFSAKKLEQGVSALKQEVVALKTQLPVFHVPAVASLESLRVFLDSVLKADLVDKEEQTELQSCERAIESVIGELFNSSPVKSLSVTLVENIEKLLLAIAAGDQTQIIRGVNELNELTQESIRKSEPEVVAVSTQTPEATSAGLTDALTQTCIELAHIRHNCVQTEEYACQNCNLLKEQLKLSIELAEDCDSDILEIVEEKGIWAQRVTEIEQENRVLREILQIAGHSTV